MNPLSKIFLIDSLIMLSIAIGISWGAIYWMEELRRRDWKTFFKKLEKKWLG